MQYIFNLILVDDGSVIDEGTLKKEINRVQCIFSLVLVMMRKLLMKEY